MTAKTVQGQITQWFCACHGNKYMTNTDLFAKANDIADREEAIRRFCEATGVKYETEDDAQVDTPADKTPEAVTQAATRDDNAFSQCIENLPDEIQSAHRFVKTGYKGNIKAAFGQWQMPENWQCWDEIDGYATFVACSDDDDGFVFYDFDHVLDAVTGKWKSDVAKSFFDFLHVDGSYCELSQSRTGLHLFAQLTPKKFPPFQGKIHFDDGSMLEVFYKKPRCCLVTGNLYQCRPGAPIVCGERADGQFLHVIEQARLDKEARNAKKNPQNQSNTVDNQRKELPPEIKALIGEINKAVTPEPLKAKGYLKKSANGNFCCPWCGSGNGDNQSGAMFYYSLGEQSHFTCFSQKVFDKEHGGDIVDLLAQVWYGDKHGQNFFKAIKRAADEFGIEYDPKIFTPPEKKAPTADDFKTGNDDADQWQKVNGVFDKQLYLEICAGRDFLQGLTPETLTAAVARSKSTARKLALCEFFDFASRAVDKFWATLDVVKKDADAQIKTATTTGEILSDEVQAAARLNFKDIRAEVNRHVTEIRKAHKAFQAELECDKRRAQHKARVADDKTTRTQKLSELESLSKQPQSSDRDNKIVEMLRDVCERKVDSFGNEYGFKNNAANAKLIFTHDPVLDGLIGFDEFQQATVFLKLPPWKNNPVCVGTAFQDSDAAHVRVYLAETYDDFGSVQKIDDMLTVTADKNSFHPVKEWLKNLPAWDGKPRAETLFVDFLRVDDTPFAREVTLNWLTAALARIAYPGCNYQTALVLHGNQGIGKSYILERLGDKWYGVLSESIDDPHALDTIQGIWICELKEFRAARKADVNTLKAFIDTAVDSRRAAYERRSKPYPRHCVFGITVNDDGFLNDLTGNRRFPVLECKSARGEYIEGLTDEYVAQVWAEVKAKFLQKFYADGKMIRDLKVVGKLLELSRETKRQVEAVAEKFLRDDGVANEIQGYLDTPRPPQVIWLTFSRDERRKFIEDKKLYVGGGKREIERRIKSRTQRKSSINHDVDELYLLLTPENEGKLFVNAGDGNALILFGTELRNHICAAEIRNECFAPNDKRNNMTRINEILPTIEGWHAGERLRNLDPEYPDQKKVFYRDEPPPDETNKDDTHNEDAPETSHDDFIGEPIDLENPPF